MRMNTMKLLLALTIAAALLGGCQTEQQRMEASDTKTMLKTVGKDRLLQTFSQLTPPPMDKGILQKSDQEMITWIKQVDDWTHKVLSSPVTGEMDKYARQEMRQYLCKVYAPEVADSLIEYFYREDERLGTYQAYSTKAMLGLRSEWGEYELKKAQPEAGVYRITLRGVNTQQEPVRSIMEHVSEYRLDGNQLTITQFKTIS
ncbi:hypothetical protein [Paenibacillus sp. YYML68]|uniref:hypothetical protein n=1 Tax=Paenibacillus sp. YYML68 TaxID=2909250 RepID=UPI00248F636A|nr:hypothetical protein [Paenibacillus sp. YYML68]